MIDHTAEWRRLNDATAREQSDRLARFWAWVLLFGCLGGGILVLGAAL